MRLFGPLGALPATALTLLLTGTCPAQEPEAKHVLRVLDVRDIVHLEPQALPATALEASFSPGDPDTGDNPLARLELGDLTTLLQEATGMHIWESEGVEMQPEDAGFLSVRCTKEQQAAVSKALAKIRHLIFETVAIEIHELPGSALASRRTVLSADEANELIAAAGSHPVHIGRTTLQRQLLIESKQIRNNIAGLGTRVASNASTIDPYLSTDAFGASWEVRATRTVGTDLLVTISGSARALDAKAETRELRTTEKGRSAEIQLATTNITTCLSSARLQPGEAMLVGSRAPNGQVLLVRVRRIGLPADLNMGHVSVFPIGTLVRGAPGAPNPALPFADATLFPRDEREPVPSVLDEGRLVEMISCEIQPDTWDGAPNTMNMRDGHLMVHANDQVLTAVHKHLKKLDAIDARQFTLEVRFGEIATTEANTSDAASIAKLAESLPQTSLSTLSASRNTQVSATRHSQVVLDYESVVASGSATTSPNIGTVTEGFLLRGAVSPMHEQMVLLDLNMTLLKRDANTGVFDMNHPALGPIDRLSVRENKVRGSTPVALGTWTILHLAPMPGGKKHVAIAARVHSL